MLLGAIANSIPDVDVVKALWLDTAEELWFHRGFTHSILFAVLATLVLSWIAKKFWKNKLSLASWMLLIGVNISIHLLIDTFNAYGTGLLEPFSDARFSFHLVFVADPLFSVFPAAAFVYLLVAKSNASRRSRWAMWGLTGSMLYIAVAVSSKIITTNSLRENLGASHLPADQLLLTPTPFNTALWYAVTKDDAGYHIGYRSVFDEQQTTFTYHPRNEHLLKNFAARQDMKYLKQFAKGYYTVENRHDTLLFNVLRFGQVAGWYDPNNRFMLYYNISDPEANELAVQRGRFQGWNRETISAFLNRIRGKQY